MPAFADLPDWEKLLAAERHVQALLPGTVLVDHVLTDLRERFDDVLARLESAAGWETNRVQRPVLILGALDGVLTGIRQLRRTEPLETQVIEGLVVPTLPEMARIKAWLLATRNTVRDYLDLLVLLERLGDGEARRALSPFDRIYRQTAGSSPLSEVVERLASASPQDLASVDLATYRGLVAPWNDWSFLASKGRTWAPLVATVALSEGAS